MEEKVVWVVRSNDYDSSAIYGIFTEEADADAWIGLFEREYCKGRYVLNQPRPKPTIGSINLNFPDNKLEIDSIEITEYNYGYITVVQKQPNIYTVRVAVPSTEFPDTSDIEELQLCAKAVAISKVNQVHQLLRDGKLMGPNDYILDLDFYTLQPE